VEAARCGMRDVGYGMRDARVPGGPDAEAPAPCQGPVTPMPHFARPTIGVPMISRGCLYNLIGKNVQVPATGGSGRRKGALQEGGGADEGVR